MLKLAYHLRRTKAGLKWLLQTCEEKLRQRHLCRPEIAVLKPNPEEI
jgi:hypothetical protein